MATDFVQADRIAANQASAKQRRLERLEAMFLTTGDGVLTIGDGTIAASELMDARALAASRWSRLLDMEGQVVREVARLAARSKQRPSEPPDRLLAPEVIRSLQDDYAKKTDAIGAQLDELRELAKTERKSLESYIVKSKA